MSAFISHQSIHVNTSSPDHEGELIFANSSLVAVLIALNPSSGHKPELWHKWFLETGYGPCSGEQPGPVFESLEAAEAWVAHKVDKARPLPWQGAYPIPCA